MSLTSTLQLTGLTTKEAAVYVATLELGLAPVLRIAQKSHIKRPTTYVVLSQLQDQGLVEAIPKEGGTFYQAVDPTVVVIHQREKTAALEQILPELRSLRNSAPSKPKIRFYEGQTSVFRLYHDEIFRHQTINSIVNMHEVKRLLTRAQTTKVFQVIRDQRCQIKDIVDDSSDAHAYIAFKQKYKLGETRLLPANRRFAVDFLIYGARVALISPSTHIGIVIEDPAIHQAHQHLFDSLWQTLE